MKDQIKELISKSRAIKNSEKAIYSKLLDFLDEEKQKQLLKIFQVEQDSVQKIENEANLEKTALNQTFVLTLDEFFKSEETKAIQKEEKEEQDDGDELLKKLNDV